MTPVILFRAGNLEQEAELLVASQYFPVYRYRSEIPKDSLVIGRFSTLPYYWELEKDLKNIGSFLINSYSQHRWISSFDYYEDLKDYTPRSWDERDFYKSGYDGPLVLKGRTNSRKQLWSTQMYCKDSSAAIDVASILANDPLIGPQGIIYREYVPLKALEICPISGMPFANEWRFFFYKENLIDFGYYWSFYENKNKIDDEAIKLAKDIAKKASKNINFFVIDLAKTKDKEWILIEFNDGQMSGLSSINPFSFYGNLFRLTEL